MSDLTPKQIVNELDRYVIGQDKAKKAVAIALRNRYRRSLLDKDIQDEITPKNIIMVGPTGVGKTEIARRLSKLMNAPFVKVEATKFTEVGYVGRDVESMVRDLVEAAIRMVKNDRFEAVKKKAEELANERLANMFTNPKKKSTPTSNPFAVLFNQQLEAPKEEQDAEKTQLEKDTYNSMLAKITSGEMDNNIVEIEVEDTPQMGFEIAGIGADMNVGEILGGILPKKTKKRKVSVKEAKKIFTQEESDKLIDMDEVVQTAIDKAEQHGIIFIDEIDKIAGKTMGQGPDVSREGVQRDILPIVEGSTVVTKYGPVKTDYMLFIAAGAFHISKVSDLIPELQGRFPIKVELQNLTKDDFKKILVQPDNAIIKQYMALLKTEGVNLSFSDDALDEIATCAQIVNETSENIGARRLHTMLENLLEDISFNACGLDTNVDIEITAQYVKEHLKEEIKDTDLQKYIL